MNIYQHLITLIKTTNPSAHLSIADVSALDQDLAYLGEVHHRLVNPEEKLSFVSTSQEVFVIASRWLSSSGVTNWLHDYLRSNGTY